MTLPNWTFNEVMIEVTNFLQNSVVAGLVMTSLALSITSLLVSTLRGIFGGSRNR
jgi:hypothetical protein